MPDTVWQIELVALLRAAFDLRRGQAQLLREGSGQRRLGGLSNNVFASRYVLYMPDREQLIAQVEAVLKKRQEEESGQ